MLDFNHVIGNHLVFFDRHAVNIEPNTNFNDHGIKLGAPIDLCLKMFQFSCMFIQN